MPRVKLKDLSGATLEVEIMTSAVTFHMTSPDGTEMKQTFKRPLIRQPRRWLRVHNA
jgi:hypothetical protein